MIITGFLQVKDELITGHLQRFFDWNGGLFDHIVALDDSSSDGSTDFLRTKVDLLIENEFCGFKSELSNKKILLQRAKELFPDTDWFLWLDADEVLFATREELEDLVNRAVSDGSDSISLRLTNLWKSEHWFRLDSSFDALSNIRLWQNLKDLRFQSEPGLHKPLHPMGIRKTLNYEDLHIAHFGFASSELIARKFASYRSLGQQGNNLWRLIDETKMELAPVADRLKVFGSRALAYFKSGVGEIQLPKQSTLYEYLLIANSLETNNAKPPFITIVSLIYSGVDWLEFQYGELLKLKREFGPGEVEILFVANDPTDDVAKFLVENCIPHVHAPGKSQTNEWYINSVYRAYNYGAKSAAGKYLLFVNSDMAYAPGFLHAMAINAHEDKYLVGKLVESGRLLPAAIAIKRNFGKTLKTFRRKSFYKFAEKIAEETQDQGGLFMPCLVSRERFLTLGGYPEGNIREESQESYIHSGAYATAKQGEPLITGDKAFVDRFIAAGGVQTTSNLAIAYHFQEGEKSSSTSSMSNKVPSGIAIANDQLIGINGEDTLWNYLIEDLDAAGFKLTQVSLGVNQRVPYRISRSALWKQPTARLLFRNATFLRTLRGPWRQLVLLQDRIQNLKLVKLQSKAVNGAGAKVTNSPEMLTLHTKNPAQHAYLQPLPVHTEWEGRKKAPRQRSKISAVFVGAFNETKGWSSVKAIIESNSSVEFVCVSKYPDDKPQFSGADTPKNVSVLRCLSNSELISVIDDADIFIVGSPFETQCLAAIEAATRNLAICMVDTGLFSQLPEVFKKRIGEFNPNLQEGFQDLFKRMQEDPNSLDPARAVEDAGLSATKLRIDWINIFKAEMEESFLPKVRKSPYQFLKSKIPLSVKAKLRNLIGK
jgi:GT2 family glycosyltransferase